jgi:hypothetical protein
MTGATAMQLRPDLEPGRQVAAHYTLKDVLGRPIGERHIAGQLRDVEWVSPTVFAAMIRNYDGLDYLIDSRIAEVVTNG